MEEIDRTVRKALNFVVTDHVDKVLDIALNREIKLAEHLETLSDDNAVPIVEPDKTICSSRVRQ